MTDFEAPGRVTHWSRPAGDAPEARRAGRARPTAGRVAVVGARMAVVAAVAVVAVAVPVAVVVRERWRRRAGPATDVGPGRRTGDAESPSEWAGVASRGGTWRSHVPDAWGLRRSLTAWCAAANDAGAAGGGPPGGPRSR